MPVCIPFLHPHGAHLRPFPEISFWALFRFSNFLSFSLAQNLHISKIFRIFAPDLVIKRNRHAPRHLFSTLFQ